MKQATLFKTLASARIRCDSCAHHCVLGPGDTGRCGVMENRDGTLISLNYGRCAAVHADPIEKKPLFHFLAGQRAFSVAASGCNMHCLHCQNADLSQSPVESGQVYGHALAAGEIVRLAEEHHCNTIAYTYSEPAIFWDYARDTAVLARERSIRNIFITNGFWSERGLAAMAPYMDAANVDLKFFTDAHYRDICSARLKPVLRTIERMKRLGIWIELTTLLIPGLNDSEQELADMALFIADLDPEIPWHISRFHPSYRMNDRPPTPVEAIISARQIGLDRGLRYVYTGNLPGEEGESTFCPLCSALLIRRFGYSIMENRLEHGKCPDCLAPVAGVWE
ncbi:AmmeMemoRadiSam system radical SAM enzyme [bacterium]|nr:AmmeMemoRadiSam system radical SAM enzyme [bacterium]